ncbi:MAG: 4-alpha-glucanotransferase [Erysipelotrichaceae bacterium]|nr:4-alpha-glucanotransferase [Erysipelotrichaceae bacterium]
MRKAGILMPVASLPGRHGCGSFGADAYRFIDLAARAGFSIWQILPLNPLGYGNSPYQPYSSFAMDDLYISLDSLAEMGLIERAPSYRRNAEVIDYDAVRKFREPYLREAYKNFRPDLNYSTFSYQEWVKNFAIFMALKKKNGMQGWLDWPDKDEKNQPVDGKLDLKPYQDEILYEVFKQYILFLQWKDLKQYANDRGIEIMGDIPFYVGIDSADVWAGRKNFLLDDDGRPIFIAGVPPDYFSATGQRWGNPIYDWDYMKKNDFSFWVERISYTQKLFDIIRIDHFRAFDTYWKINAECPTAIDGVWVEAPGYELFDTLLKKTEDLELVAEDLGDLRPEVHKLRDHYNFRGMRVIQFAFLPEESDVHDKPHQLVYTGTHDNDTIFAWYREKPQAEKRKLRRYLRSCGINTHSFADDVITYSLNTQADMVVIPLTDWLHYGHEARLNTPGTVGSPNWMWRTASLSGFAKKTKEIRRKLEAADRIRKEDEE